MELAVNGDHSPQHLDPQVDGALAHRAVGEADLGLGECVTKQQSKEGGGFLQILSECGGHGDVGSSGCGAAG